MNALICFILAVCVGTIQGSNQHVRCERKFKKIGCLKGHHENNAKRPEHFLITDQDELAQQYGGFLFDWDKTDASMHSLACRCEKAAKEKGHKYFYIIHFAECWGISSLDHTQESNACVNSLFETCKGKQVVGDKECVGGTSDDGEAFSGYFYETEQKNSGEKVVDGGLSNWSSWTRCSKTCGDGMKARERACDNPLPSGQGKDCEGDLTQTVNCNEGDCRAYELNKAYYFNSYNFPNHWIGLRWNNEALITTARKPYKLVPALNGKSEAISLQSVTSPNKYLRHQNYIVKEHSNDGSQLFKDDATFFVRENKYFSGYNAFESTNFPGHYIRHYGYTLFIHHPTQMWNGEWIFQRDASFKFVKKD